MDANKDSAPPNREARRRLNRNYKDTLFRVILRKKENFRKAINAVSGSDYGPDTPMEDVTLDHTLVVGVRNDVSFKIDGKIFVFVEHQSTINQNMPLRMLLYAAATLEAETDRQKLYTNSAIEVPDMVFNVFYNGDEPLPARMTLKLSDMRPADRKNFPPNLELVVDIYNINTGNNQEILDCCEDLSDYQTFVGIARRYLRETGGDLEETLRLAIAECKERKILENFLKTYAMEIEYMVLTEWDLDEAQEAWENKGREEGIGIGMRRGREEGIGIGMERGRLEERREIITLIEQGASLNDIKRMFNTKPIRRR